MATAWITYAWKDNEDQMIEFVAQELEAAGLNVKLDRWDSYPAGTTFAGTGLSPAGTTNLCTAHLVHFSQPCDREGHARLDGEGLETDATAHGANPSPYRSLQTRIPLGYSARC